MSRRVGAVLELLHHRLKASKLGWLARNRIADATRPKSSTRSPNGSGCCSSLVAARGSWAGSSSAPNLLVPRSSPESESLGESRRGHGTGDPAPAREPNFIPVMFGEGRLRFRSQVFEVQIGSLGPASAECEICRDRGLLIVKHHLSYDEAERGG